MSFTIVTDSTTYLPADLVRTHQVTIVPLSLTFDGVTYRDGIDIVADRFYRQLPHLSRLPATAPPALEDFRETYQRLAQTHDGILSVHLSGDYSQTVETARTAAAQVSAPIEVVDSRSISMGTGFLILEAARARQAGAGLAETAAAVRRLTERVQVRLIVDDLRYLQMGGRIGAAQRWLGAALTLKPILAIEDGRTAIAGTARGHRAALQSLLTMLRDSAGSRPVHAAVAHAAATRDALWLYDQIADELNVAELHFCDLSPVVGAHVGPGAVGIVHFVEQNAD